MSILDNLKSLSFYMASNNNFLIVNLPEGFIWENNHEFRGKIAQIGRESRIDSVLILSGNPFNFNNQGYHCSMEVYEPRSDSISTMCGNGVRAVCRYWLDHGYRLEKNQEFVIKTRSGLRRVRLVGDLFRVNMGFLSTNVSDLKRYVNPKKIMAGKKFEDIKFPNEIFLGRNYLIKEAIIGLTGDKDGDKIDGEPHLIFFLNGGEYMSMQALKDYTIELGGCLTVNRNIFPHEINVSIVSKGATNNFYICTYERGVYYVTQSCGTATAVAGGYLLQNLDIKKITIQTLGGELLVERDSSKIIYLTGSAEPLNNFRDNSSESLALNA